MTRRQVYAGFLFLLVAGLTQLYVVATYGAERVQGNVALLTLPVSLWFMSLYARDPWWKSWFGRSLMLIAVAIAVDASATVLFREFGDYPGREVMLIVSADLTFLAMLIRTLVLRAEQHADVQDKSHHRPR